MENKQEQNLSNTEKAEVRQIISERKDLSSEMRKNAASYLIAAFGLIAGLAWNEAVRSAINYVFPPEGIGGVFAKFLYAILLTFIAVLVAGSLVRYTKSEDKK